MAVIVKQDAIITLNNQADCINYLATLFISQWDPFTIHTQVRVANRSGLPGDVAAFDVGLLSFGRVEVPIVNLLTLTTDGLFTVTAVPKVNIVHR